MTVEHELFMRDWRCKRDCRAKLIEDSPFRCVFRDGWVPIMSLTPVLASLIGEGLELVYFVDLDRLSGEQFDELVQLLIERHGGTPEQVHEQISRVPLRRSQTQAVYGGPRTFAALME